MIAGIPLRTLALCDRYFGTITILIPRGVVRWNDFGEVAGRAREAGDSPSRLSVLLDDHHPDSYRHPRRRRLRSTTTRSLDLRDVLTSSSIETGEIIYPKEWNPTSKPPTALQPKSRHFPSRPENRGSSIFLVSPTFLLNLHLLSRHRLELRGRRQRRARARRAIQRRGYEARWPLLTGRETVMTMPE